MQRPEPSTEVKI